MQKKLIFGVKHENGQMKKSTESYLMHSCPQDIKGKTIIVTGASSGVGKKAAEELAWLGAKVIMACRNLPKAESVRSRILADNPNAQLELMQLDIASRKSIYAFVNELKDKEIDVYGLVNNAGTFKQRGKTADGLELVSGTNYFGTLMLLEAVLPYLQTLPHEVRVTTTSSISCYVADIDYDDYFCTRGYNALKVYSRSKLSLTLYTINRAAELKDSNILLLMTHPGISATPLANRAFGERFEKILEKLTVYVLQSPEKSALSIPYVMTNPVDAGALYGPRGFLYGWGLPSRNKLPSRANREDPRLQEFTNTIIESV